MWRLCTLRSLLRTSIRRAREVVNAPSLNASSLADEPFASTARAMHRADRSRPVSNLSGAVEGMTRLGLTNAWANSSWMRMRTVQLVDAGDVDEATSGLIAED